MDIEIKMDMEVHMTLLEKYPDISKRTIYKFQTDYGIVEVISSDGNLYPIWKEFRATIDKFNEENKDIHSGNIDKLKDICKLDKELCETAVDMINKENL